MGFVEATRRNSSRCFGPSQQQAPLGTRHLGFRLAEARRGHQHQAFLSLSVEHGHSRALGGDRQLKAPYPRSVIESHAWGTVRGDTNPKADVSRIVNDLNPSNL